MILALGAQGLHIVQTISQNPYQVLLLSYPWGIYYLWEKYGLGNPAPSPLKCAEVTLDLLYSCFILSSKALELTSDQEAPDTSLMWRIGENAS